MSLNVKDFQYLVGQKEKDATNDLKSQGLKLRVVKRDGKNEIITMDLRSNRVNVSLDKGVISEIVSIA